MCIRNYILIVVLVVCISLATGVFAQEKSESEIDIDQIVNKLNEVLDNQEKILEEFSEIKKELAIIKVRASRR